MSPQTFRASDSHKPLLPPLFSKPSDCHHAVGTMPDRSSTPEFSIKPWSVPRASSASTFSWSFSSSSWRLNLRNRITSDFKVGTSIRSTDMSKPIASTTGLFGVAPKISSNSWAAVASIHLATFRGNGFAYTTWHTLILMAMAMMWQTVNTNMAWSLDKFLSLMFKLTPLNQPQAMRKQSMYGQPSIPHSTVAAAEAKRATING
mmetsp:Transcript_3100/g.12048  ORF Transcript_3100/g.12048 Transcript_3100/m.12048 type:complete len:204 (+) Transcript_3100:682-1293(+)